MFFRTPQLRLRAATRMEWTKTQIRFRSGRKFFTPVERMVPAMMARTVQAFTKARQQVLSSQDGRSIATRTMEMLSAEALTPIIHLPVELWPLDRPCQSTLKCGLPTLREAESVLDTRPARSALVC